MKTIILAAAVVALTIASAQAQDPSNPGAGFGGAAGGRHHGQQKNAKAAPARSKADEKAYTSALKGIPDKSYDAWHGVR